MSFLEPFVEEILIFSISKNFFIFSELKIGSESE